MKLSCNGCRVLRRGCGDDCTLKSCLTWIMSPESQANVTLFLAKFYGRIGLLNLISVVEDQFRPYLFKSLLYEACGRIVSPVNGSLGLFLSRRWDMLEAAVDAVMRISTIPDHLKSPHIPSLMACNIRHVSKITNHNAAHITPQSKYTDASTSEEGLGDARRACKKAKILVVDEIDLELTLGLPGNSLPKDSN